MEQRDAPVRNQPVPKKMILDPSAYSMTGNADIPEETFEESDEITASLLEDDDEPVSLVNVQNLPDSEEL